MGASLFEPCPAKVLPRRTQQLHTQSYLYVILIIALLL